MKYSMLILAWCQMARRIEGPQVPVTSGRQLPRASAISRSRTTNHAFQTAVAASSLSLAALLILSALPASAESTKTVWVSITNPLETGGVAYQVTDDAISSAKAIEEIQGHSADGSALGRIGTAFFVFDAAKLGVQIALNGSYDIKNISVADYRSPEIQNDTLKLAILFLVEYSTPQVSLGYATVDVVLFLITGKTLDDWAISAIGAVGQYSSQFIDTLPTTLSGLGSWIKENAGQIWNQVPKPSGWAPCALALAPLPILLEARILSLKRATETLRGKH